MQNKWLIGLGATALFGLASCVSGENQPKVEEGIQLYGAKVAVDLSSIPDCKSTSVGQLY